MKILTELYCDGSLQCNDVMLVPVAISYDNLIESTTFVNEMLGEPKQKESLSTLINSANNVVRLNYGSIDISICNAISLKQSIADYVMTINPSPPYQYFTLTKEQQRRALLFVSHHVMYDMNLKMIVTATSIVATVLLTTTTRGIHRQQIIDRTQYIKSQVQQRGATVSHIFDIESIGRIVDRTLVMLSSMIKIKNNIVHSFRNRESLELSIYRNQLIHWFASESLMIVAMSAELHTNNIDKVSKLQLITSVRLISQLLKFEFVFQPTPDIETNVDVTLDTLCNNHIINEHIINNELYYSVNTREHRDYIFLALLVWPFVELYWNTLHVLRNILILQPIIDERKLAELIGSDAEATYYSGKLDFFESLNVDGILNVIDWAVSQKILIRINITESSSNELKHIANNKFNSKLITMAPAYISTTTIQHKNTHLTINNTNASHSVNAAAATTSTTTTPSYQSIKHRPSKYTTLQYKDSDSNRIESGVDDIDGIVQRISKYRMHRGLIQFTHQLDTGTQKHNLFNTNSNNQVHNNPTVAKL